MYSVWQAERGGDGHSVSGEAGVYAPVSGDVRVLHGVAIPGLHGRAEKRGTALEGACAKGVYPGSDPGNADRGGSDRVPRSADRRVFGGHEATAGPGASGAGGFLGADPGRAHGGLDPKQRIEIRNFISRISLDKIVLIATHVVSDVEYIAKTALILKNGRLIDCAPPHDLSQKINGKVWRVACRPDEVATLSQSLRVVGISKEEGSTEVLLRVISEACPVQGALEAEATLEDYYLYTFSELQRE